MTINEQLERVKYAVEHDELKQLFLGQGRYQSSNLKHIPANVPCDISAVLKYGLYPLYQNGDGNIPQVLFDTIVSFLDGDAVEVWTAYSIVWSQYRNELKRLSPFGIISDRLLITLRHAIEQKKDELSSCKEYTGASDKNGLMGDIVASNNSFQRIHGVSIL